jgi:hypothetical protein
VQAALVRSATSLLPRQDGEVGRASWYDIAAASTVLMKACFCISAFLPWALRIRTSVFFWSKDGYHVVYMLMNDSESDRRADTVFVQ